MTDNELIDEFMGITNNSYTASTKVFLRALAGESEYNTSWDWLMPVVEKINSLNYTVHIYPTRARFYKTSIDFIESIHPGFSLIEIVYCGVVEFIKWYKSFNK